MADENNSFIKENVNNKSSSFSKTLKKLLRIALAGLVFGAVAVCAAVISKPFAEKTFGKKEEPSTHEVVTIPRDEETVPAKPVMPAAIETTEEETTEAVEDIVQNAMEGYTYTVDDLDKLWKNLSELCNSVDTSIVTVRSVKNGKDLFENKFENQGSYSGIVIAQTDSEVMILIPEDAIKNADSLSVSWSSGNEQRAYIKQSDSICGLAILSAKKSEMDELTRKICVPVRLGNSYLMNRGDIVVAVGSPMGVSHSTAYSWISYIDNGLEIADGTAKIINTNNAIDGSKGTWIINTRGELIGWATQKFTGKPDVAALSDFKSQIERMINMGSYAYLGVVTTEVSLDMEEDGMPVGVYVLNVAKGSPAYHAGIQPGDVISMINDTKISTVSILSKTLEEAKPEEEVKLAVFRDAIDEYKEIDFDVVLGSRSER